MNKHWQSFWDHYRNTDARTEDELFVQVGKTISRQPIPRDMFESMVERIIGSLQLGTSDYMLDMCCGNGLISFELGQVAGHVTGVDFAEHMIRSATKFKTRPNIDYLVGDVSLPIADMLGRAITDEASMPCKYLMNDALAYFEPTTLDTIIGNICAARSSQPFRLLLTGIPNTALKWNFYNTPERKRRHSKSLRTGDATNDGLGRWWDATEIESICNQRGLDVSIENQPHAISNYRMDALIWRT